MRSEAIAEVGIDDEGRVFIVPHSSDFEQIYRAAMEVYWDHKTRRLSHPESPRAWTPPMWFQQIIAAAADEHGVSLKVTDETAWVNIPTEMRADMETALLPPGP